MSRPTPLHNSLPPGLSFFIIFPLSFHSQAMNVLAVPGDTEKRLGELPQAMSRIASHDCVREDDTIHAQRYTPPDAAGERRDDN